MTGAKQVVIATCSGAFHDGYCSDMVIADHMESQ